MAEAQTADGVSGISKKELADKIAVKLRNSLYKSNKVASTIISEAAEKIAGIQLAKGHTDWNWCFYNTTTDIACPMMQFSNDKRAQFSVMVAIFNPATTNVNHTRI